MSKVRTGQKTKNKIKFKAGTEGWHYVLLPNGRLFNDAPIAYFQFHGHAEDFAKKWPEGDAVVGTVPGESSESKYNRRAIRRGLKQALNKKYGSTSNSNEIPTEVGEIATTTIKTRIYDEVYIEDGDWNDEDD